MIGDLKQLMVLLAKVIKGVLRLITWDNFKISWREEFYK